MKWYAWLATASLTAVVGLFSSGLLAGLLVDWYNVSSFEGGSGFFVIGIALLGGIAGFVVGLLASAFVAIRPNPRLPRAIGIAVGVALAIVLVIGGVARLLADIPPLLGGETVFLNVELRWPPSGKPAPSALSGLGRTQLGTMRGSTVRRTEEGPLWLDDARQENGQWIVPGAAHVFTSRGRRFLAFAVGDTHLAAVEVPLPGHPGEAHETWSEWLPAPASASDPSPYAYRFRVVRATKPLRVQHEGPFEVGVSVRGFYHVSNAEGTASYSVFDVSHRGEPVAGAGDTDYVAVVPGARPALFLRGSTEDGAVNCRFVISEGDRARVADLGPCVTPTDVQPLTSDAARYRAARTRRVLPGWLDRVSFGAPGLYQAGEMILDSRQYSARRYTPPSDPYPRSDIPPLGLSPDERSLILFAQDGEERPLLVVKDTVADRAYSLPIDRRRMRYSMPESLDPGWVNHHFAWVRNAEGIDRLQQRASFALLPYKGDLSIDDPSSPYYTVRPGGEPLRQAVISILTADLGGELLPGEPSAFDRRVKVDGVVVEISVLDSGNYVYLGFERGTGSLALMQRVAARVDAALATGKWDHAFAEVTEDGREQD